MLHEDISIYKTTYNQTENVYSMYTRRKMFSGVLLHCIISSCCKNYIFIVDS